MAFPWPQRLGAVVVVVNLERCLPTDRWLVFERVLVVLHGSKMQSATLAALETRPIVEDACSIDHPGVRPSLITENTTFERGVGVLKDLVVDRQAQGPNTKRFVLVDHLGADRTASLVQICRGAIEYSFAAVVPNAGPVRVDEVDIDVPCGAIDGINIGLETASSRFAHPASIAVSGQCPPHLVDP